MRIKVTILLFVISTILIGQNHYSQQQITQMLKNLYANIAIICSDPYTFSLDKIDSIKRLNCTENYFKEIENQGMLDYDPLINAQDFSPDYLKTLIIKKDIRKDDIYYVSYITPYDKRKITIKLKIAKEKESYKIDYVFLDSP